MQLHQLKRKHPNKKSKRVARGGVRGKTAGRGTKGQKSRAGHRLRPEFRDIIKKYPKRRGFKFKSIAKKPTPINLVLVERMFVDGESVNPETLFARNAIKKKGGHLPKVKILASGNISKKVIVSGCLISATARKAIEDSGGTVI